MSYAILDGLTRRAALLTLGAAGLAGLRGSTATEAETRQRTKKKCDVEKLCKRQTGQCIDLLKPTCNGDPECEGFVKLCCPKFGKCDPVGFIACISPA
jgi:hypothetical protein